MRRQANNVERGRKKVSGTFSGRRCANCRRGIAEKVPGTFFRGLTLIELLVTIVIMVTVLGAVIPIISPNNNQRKIREAARQLNSLIQQAQAQAARDGRPAGIGFRELNTSGIALEAYIIAEPPPFAGFSPNSRVWIDEPGMVYGPGSAGAGGPIGNGGIQFAQYNDFTIYRLNLVVGGTVPAPLDSFPPRMLRIGDIVQVGGNEFLIVDDDDPTSMPNQLEEDQDGNAPDYLWSDPSAPGQFPPGTNLHCIWLNGNGQPLPTGLSVRRMYLMRRQPSNTSDQPMQFPRGIGIDLQASGATIQPGLVAPVDFPFELDVVFGSGDIIGLMFASDGAFNGMYVNGRRVEGVDQIFMLLALFENGNDGNTPDWHERYDFITNPITPPGDDDLLAQRRVQVNWLHPDSRWVSLNRAGRTAVAENNISFDPSSDEFLEEIRQMPQQDQREAQFNKQRGAARVYAAQMQSEGGR